MRMRPSKEFVAGLSLVAVVAGLGTAACSSAAGNANTAPASTSVSAPKCLSLDSLNLIGTSKSGGENAVNTGECAAVYNPHTSKTIGEIAGGQSFVIECEDIKPTAFKVVTSANVTGYTNLDATAFQQSEDGVFTAAVPTC